MKIAFLLYPQILTTAISIPIEMFHAANQAPGRIQHDDLCIRFVGERYGPVRLAGGLEVVATADFAADIDADLAFVPPMWGSPWHIIASQQAAQQWLQRYYQQGGKIIATGTGVGLVAAAGLLAGRVATTHWYYLARFKRRFEHVNFQEQHFVTHQDGIYCAGSINAQTELILYFVEKLFGQPALALVEQQFMHEIKRRIATPYYEPGGHVHNDEMVSQVQSWIRSNFRKPVNAQQLQQVAGQSARQLRRRFTQATGQSPVSYMTRIRLQEAQSLLRDTDLSITEIAYSIGYGTAAYFAKQFKKSTAMTATEYRNMVRKKTFTE